eukprot:gene37060-44979_t
MAVKGAAQRAVLKLMIHHELTQFRLNVQCQVPLFVATKQAKIKKASLFVASPEGYARAAVVAIGYDTVMSPYWSHALQIQMYWLLNLPESIAAFITKTMN